MSDEEKKAIEYLKSSLYGNEGCKFIDVAQSDLRILLNLIENQYNEIEELKENIRKRIIYCHELEKDLFEKCSNYVVSKAKIEAKIEEADKILERNLLVDSIRDYFEAQKDILQSLLKEEE